MLRRSIGYYSPDLATMLSALLASLRGSVCIYQGEELGLPESDVPFEQMRDPYGIAFWPDFKGRDGCRTPMPWDDTDHADFTAANPWLPVMPAHRELSVARQADEPESPRRRRRASRLLQSARFDRRRMVVKYELSVAAIGMAKTEAGKTTMQFQNIPLFSLAAILVVAIFLAPAPAGAASYVLMTDEDLADGADIVVEARVVDVRHPGLYGGPAVTEYVLSSVDSLIGEAPTKLSVRILGGPAGGVRHFAVHGAPSVAFGERALWFLTRRDDGTFEPFQFGLGVFRRVDRASGEAGSLAVREVSEGHWNPERIGRAPAEALGLVRDYGAFARWLSDRGRGRHDGPMNQDTGRAASGGYLVKARPAETGLRSSGQAPQPVLGRFGLFGIRWCEFDNDQAVTWVADSDGFPGATFDEYAIFQNALQAWEDDPRTPVDHSYGGTSPAPGDGVNDGFVNAPDGITGITFDDPNDEIAGSFDCMSGGVLALGGAWFDTNLSCAGYDTAIEGEIIVQDGSACFYNGNGGKNAEEVFGHELGHALGFAHSEEPQALMRASAYADGRGAWLASDDLVAMSFLYGDGDLMFIGGFETGATVGSN